MRDMLAPRFVIRHSNFVILLGRGTVDRRACVVSLLLPATDALPRPRAASRGHQRDYFMDDFGKLKTHLPMLKLMSDDPFVTIRAQVERVIREKVAGAVLTDFRATSEPQVISSVRKPEPGVDKVILKRAGIAFEYELTFKEITDDTHQLKGVFTWVVVHLDEPAKTQGRMWFDVNVTLEKYGATGELKTRLFYVE
jgi:hypothetical protein